MRVVSRLLGGRLRSRKRGVSADQFQQFMPGRVIIWPQGQFTGQPPLVIATLLAALSAAAVAAYWWLDRNRGHRDPGASGASQRFSLRDLTGFGPAYWYLLVLCVLWYSVIFAFRNSRF